MNWLTGSCNLSLTKEVLANSYENFYCNNRGSIDGKHVALEDRPNSVQLAFTQDRIAWIDKFLPHIESVIDFFWGGAARLHALITKRRELAQCT